MADEADVANDHMQKTLDLTMSTVNVLRYLRTIRENVFGVGRPLKRKTNADGVASCVVMNMLRLINYDN
jgi:hypothetical protein